jgi:hypothetical protein
MKNILIWALIAFSTSSVAQMQMKPRYNSYTTYVLDTDTGVIYQTVVVDGYTQGTCTFTYVCGPNNQQCTGTYPGCTTSTHKSKIYNKINGVGGWTYGPAVSPFTYSTYSTTNHAFLGSGETPDTDVESGVDCSQVGPIWPPIPPGCRSVKVGSDPLEELVPPERISALNTPRSKLISKGKTNVCGKSYSELSRRRTNVQNRKNEKARQNAGS